jgi:hypothetical protein
MAHSRRNFRLRKWLIGLGLMIALPGCVLLPPYHQPQGFSSTYYRHLQQTAPSPGVMIDSPDFQNQPDVSNSAASNSGGLLSWRRKPDANTNSPSHTDLSLQR